MKNKKGFTLIEALAVLVILSLLITFSVVSVSKIKKKQEIENRINVIRSILTAARAYEADHPDTYPSSGLPVSTLLRENYVDFDTNKYSEFKSKKVYGAINNNVKKSFYIEVSVNKTYSNINVSDCGFETYQDSDEEGKKLCLNSTCSGSVSDYKCGGWKKNGKYYTINNGYAGDFDFK